MNCPSRPDSIEGHPDWNQNPQALSSDLTTQADLNGIANQREQRDHGLGSHLDVQEEDRAWDTQTKRLGNLNGKSKWEPSIQGSYAVQHRPNPSDQSQQHDFKYIHSAARVKTKPYIPPPDRASQSFIPLRQIRRARVHDCSCIHRPWKLRNRCRSRCNNSIFPSLHYPHGQPLRDLPPIALYQTR